MKRLALVIAAVTVAVISVWVLTAGGRHQEAARRRSGGRVQRLSGDARCTGGQGQVRGHEHGHDRPRVRRLEDGQAGRQPAQGQGGDESGDVGEIGPVPAGQARTLTLTLKRGHYSLICNLPGHYVAGQFADFYVR